MSKRVIQSGLFRKALAIDFCLKLHSVKICKKLNIDLTHTGKSQIENKPLNQGVKCLDWFSQIGLIP
jgi:hypothetical protein